MPCKRQLTAHIFQMHHMHTKSTTSLTGDILTPKAASWQLYIETQLTGFTQPLRSVLAATAVIVAVQAEQVGICRQHDINRASAQQACAPATSAIRSALYLLPLR